MNEITHNNLPEAVTQLRADIGEIKRLLLERGNEHHVEGDHWFDLSALCEYIPDKPAKATAYGWVHHSLIPFHKKSKKLFFLKSEIDLWLKAGRRKTVSEITIETENELANRKK